MIRSMTGYGRGEAASSDFTVVIELRSVNNRFRDIQLRCPREYMALEPRINGLLRQPFSRGRIDAFIRRTFTGSQLRVTADRILALEYARAIEILAADMGDGVDCRVPLHFLLERDGVLHVSEEEVDVMSEWDIVETALKSAMDDLQAMRVTEGQALYRELSSQLAEMKRALAEVEAVAVGVNERLRAKLEGRLQRMLGDRFDAQRVVQEAAVLADKADVQEELARLRSHCDQFGEALEADEPVGRRLDFLVQEMNREVNTIGSKAAEHPISHRVVDMKSILERIREQSANVE